MFNMGRSSCKYKVSVPGIGMLVHLCTAMKCQQLYDAIGREKLGTAGIDPLTWASIDLNTEL